MLDFPNRCPFANRRELPDCMALYAVYANDDLLYLGQSWQLRGRFQSHHKLEAFYREGATHVVWQPYDDAQKLSDIEHRLIVELKPRLNASTRHRGVTPPYAARTKPLDEYKGASETGRVVYDLLWEYIESSPSQIEALRSIATRTGLSLSWLKLFAQPDAPEPAMSRLECLYTALTGKAFTIGA